MHGAGRIKYWASNDILFLIKNEMKDGFNQKGF